MGLTRSQTFKIEGLLPEFQNQAAVDPSIGSRSQELTTLQTAILKTLDDHFDAKEEEEDNYNKFRIELRTFQSAIDATLKEIVAQYDLKVKRFSDWKKQKRKEHKEQHRSSLLGLPATLYELALG